MKLLNHWLLFCLGASFLVTGSAQSDFPPCTWIGINGEESPGWTIKPGLRSLSGSDFRALHESIGFEIHSYDADGGAQPWDLSYQLQQTWSIEDFAAGNIQACIPSDQCTTITLDVETKQDPYPFDITSVLTVFLRDRDNPLPFDGWYRNGSYNWRLVTQVGDCQPACGPDETLLRIQSDVGRGGDEVHWYDWMLLDSEQQVIARCPRPEGQPEERNARCYWGADNFVFVVDSICIPQTPCYTLALYEGETGMNEVEVTFDGFPVLSTQNTPRFQSVFFGGGLGTGFNCGDPCSESLEGDDFRLDVFQFNPSAAETPPAEDKEEDLGMWSVTRNDGLVLLEGINQNIISSPDDISREALVFEYQYTCTNRNDCLTFEYSTTNVKSYDSQVKVDNLVYVQANHRKDNGNGKGSDISDDDKSFRYSGNQTVIIGSCDPSQICAEAESLLDVIIYGRLSFSYSQWEIYEGPDASDTVGIESSTALLGEYEAQRTLECLQDLDESQCTVLGLESVHDDDAARDIEVALNGIQSEMIDCMKYENAEFDVAFNLAGSECSNLCVPRIELLVPYLTAATFFLAFFCFCGMFLFYFQCRRKVSRNSNAESSTSAEVDGATEPVAKPVLIELPGSNLSETNSETIPASNDNEGEEMKISRENNTADGNAGESGDQEGTFEDDLRHQTVAIDDPDDWA